MRRTSSRRAGSRRPGCEVESDAAGNLIGRLRGTSPELPELWTGSHLDSVPEGGRLDGALGVVAGIEAIGRIGRQEQTLAVIAFRGEEVGCIGSRARCAESSVLPGAFLELHIEQGPELERAGAPLAVRPRGSSATCAARSRRPAAQAMRARHRWTFGRTPSLRRPSACLQSGRPRSRSHTRWRRSDSCRSSQAPRTSSRPRSRSASTRARPTRLG